MKYGCGGCDKTWGGLKSAHCAKCHRTFTTVAGFDTHHDISQWRFNRPAECMDPSSVGLVYVAARGSYRFMNTEEEKDSNEVV